jgi:GntR family transcriptional regulator, histidine utilization repressor
MDRHLLKLSLHTRIRGDIEAHIIAGEWPAGHRIPLEHELMEQYGCSRMTVNKAVSALAAEGLIIRNRRAGSFVARPRMHSAVMQIPDIRHEVEARGGVYAYKCLKIEACEPHCLHFGKKEREPGRSLHIRSVHLSDGEPLMLEERHIFLNAVPAAAKADFNAQPPGSWLLEHVPWTEAENRISAIAANAATAKVLGVKAGSACLLVERRTWRGAETVTKVRQTFRGDAYHVTAHFGVTAQ